MSRRLTRIFFKLIIKLMISIKIPLNPLSPLLVKIIIFDKDAMFFLSFSFLRDKPIISLPILQ